LPDVKYNIVAAANPTVELIGIELPSSAYISVLTVPGLTGKTLMSGYSTKQREADN